MVFQPSVSLIMRSNNCSPEEIEKSTVSSAKSVNQDEQSLQSRRTAPNRKTRKQITFNEQVFVKEVEHINDMTKKEVNTVWYSKSEYQMMRFAFAVTVRKVMCGEYKGDSAHQCARGLEFVAPTCYQRRMITRLEVLVQVLEEQERQNKAGEVDPESLSLVYMRANEPCSRIATQMGDLDAKEASRISTGKGSITAIMFTTIASMKEECGRRSQQL